MSTSPRPPHNTPTESVAPQNQFPLNPTMTAPRPTDDQLLLAVRYVLNECSVDEAAALEVALAEDAAAQQALVEAVQIVSLLQSTPNCEAIAASQTSVVPVRPVRQWGAVARMAGALVAAGIVLGAVVNLSPPRGPVAPLDLVATNPALPQVWSNLSLESSLVSESADGMDEVSEDDADRMPGSQASTNDVPDWLLTAVLVEEESHDSGEEMGLDEESQL